MGRRRGVTLKSVLRGRLSTDLPFRERDGVWDEKYRQQRGEKNGSKKDQRISENYIGVGPYNKHSTWGGGPFQNVKLGITETKKHHSWEPRPPDATE